MVHLIYKNFLDDLKTKGSQPIYLFYGEEEYLINYLTEKIKEIFKSQDSIFEFNLDILNREYSCEEIVDKANTMPVLASKRLIVVLDKNIFKSEERSNNSRDNLEVLLDYIKNPNDKTCLVFTFSGNIDKRSKVYNEITKKGTVIECKQLKGSQLIKWIKKRCEKNGKEIENQAAYYLSSIIGSNLSIIDLELKKIFSYLGDREEINIQDVKAVCSRTLLNNIFELVDSLAEQNHEKAVNYFRDMILTGEPPAKILYMIIRQYRLILRVKILQSEGYKLNHIIKYLDLQPFVAKKLLKQSAFYEIDEIRMCLKQLLDLDVKLKTSTVSVPRALEAGILQLAKTR